MIGAHKIDDTTDDLERLQEFFDRGLNNSQIQREYRTNTGEQISRVHISQIRRGRRWNQELRSFLMKNELDNPLPCFPVPIKPKLMRSLGAKYGDPSGRIPPKTCRGTMKNEPKARLAFVRKSRLLIEVEVFIREV